MGYYTEYALSSDAPHLEEEMAEKLNEINSGYEILFGWNDCRKWYDHQDHMKQLSNLYPNVLFKLEGKGEEDGDLWIMYFKNGKMQYCRAEIVITFDEFDETKLK